MLNQRLVHLLLAVLVLPAIAFAQNTTSSINGTAKTSTGEALIGATITAIHEPTGTIYKVQTRAGGRFDINNLTPGGPYSIEATFLNYNTEKKTDIYLSLGETFKVDFALAPKSVEITGVTVTGTRKTVDATAKGGTEVTIGRDKMQNLPTVGRNLNDYLRAIPQAKLASSNNEGVTIAGQNTRYNSFYIDGALNNDVFGLANSGTNGGQTSTPPLSIDAIDQFQVLLSPYDASLGNFVGGGINAVTRSGTNKMEGSLYYFYRNQDLAGKTPTGDKSAATKLADFTNKTYGFRIGGPIIKNKLFYFLNVEWQRDKRPQPFDVSSGYNGNTKSPADIQRLIDTLNARGGYNPGSYLDNPETIDADRVASKVDWNISDKQKLSVSYRYTKADRYNTNSSNSSGVNFYNNGWIQPNRTHSASVELRSVTGKSSSNRLLLTYTNVSDDRTQIGSPYPRVVIFDGTGTSSGQGLIVGPDPSTNINILTQKNYNVLDVFKFNIGAHTMSVGGEWEYNDVKNAFIQRSWGEYQYDSVQAFYANAKPRQYRVAYSLIDSINGDATNAAAAFKISRWSAFINDELRVGDNLTLNFGVRADYTKWMTTPVGDPFANNVAIPKWSALYDLQGAQSGVAPKIPVSISPRFGFSYKIPEENVVIRGGAGYFTSRIPLVWPGGVYNNNGLFIGGFTVSSSANAAALNTVRFRSNPYGQWTATELGLGITKGAINLISKKFRNPRVFRTTLAVDKKFGDGWSTTVESIFSKNINEVYYTNLNAQAPIATLTGPGGGGRLIYSPTALPITTSTPANPYDNAILLTNSDHDKGFAYNFSVLVDKRTRNGFGFTASYNYGTSYVINEATSSVNVSQWQFMETVNGRNNITRSQSDFSAGHRIFAYASKKFIYAKGILATTISLVYNGQSGAPFSYVYSGAITKDDASAGGSGGNDLIYIPTQTEMGSLAIANNTVGSGSAAITYNRQQQLDALNAYIENDGYLKKNRGKFADRNGSRLPFTNTIDLKIAQDFNIKLGGHRYQFQLTYDIFNFGNMLNRDWGRNYFLSNDQFAVISFRGFTAPGITNPVSSSSAATNQVLTTYGSTSAAVTAPATVPVFSFNPQNVGRSPWNVSTGTAPSVSARWISQIGIRFNF